MIDKSKQLVLRVDLYFAYILVVVAVISACEVPFIAVWIEAMRYLMPAGWMLLLALAIRRMWAARVAQDLTSDLQLYKIALCLLIIGAISPLVLKLAIWGPEQVGPIGLAPAIKMVFAVNGMAVLDVYAIGILGIYLFEKARS